MWDQARYGNQVLRYRRHNEATPTPSERQDYLGTVTYGRISMKHEKASPTSGRVPEKLAALFSVEELPNARYRERWDATYVSNGIKPTAFNTVAMQPIFRRARSLIGGRRDIIVLTGEAGNGKSTLAGGLCNVYAERGQGRDGLSTILLTANASRWFGRHLGDSPKIVDDVFQSLRLLLMRQRVALIVNELESVATNRGSLSAGDPTDVHRFVNSLLNGLDNLPVDAEFLMVATSNQLDMIDPAFLDRVVHQFHLGYCNGVAAKAILRDVARAYRRVGLEIPDSLIDQVVKALYDASDRAPQLSGRSLSDLFRVTMERFATFRPRPDQVITVARQLSRRNDNGDS